MTFQLLDKISVWPLLFVIILIYHEPYFVKVVNMYLFALHAHAKKTFLIYHTSNDILLGDIFFEAYITGRRIFTTARQYSLLPEAADFTNLF